MRTILIEEYIDLFRKSLGKPHEPASAEALRKYFAERAYAKLAGLIRSELKISARVRLGLVKSGGPATTNFWARIPYPVPPYGTEAFTRSVITLFLRKSFLESLPFELLVIGIAKPLTGFLLKSIGSRVADDEAAVDVAAMFLGYSDFYLKAWTHNSVDLLAHNLLMLNIYDPADLTEKEAVYTADILKQLRSAQ